MSILAKYSSYRLSNLKIAFVVLVVLSVWCIYDGYYNDSFIDKHTKIVVQDDIETAKPDHTLIFCRKFPYLGIPLAIAAAAAFFGLKNKNIRADNDGLYLADNKFIKYNSIEELDHTDYDTKGKFYLLYETGKGKQKITFSQKTWDELDSLLEHLIAKMS